ncbi:MAG: cobalt transporter [Leptospiraceae bacterium]|nr:MAG: cobalt transporter [Leptospiraceae bacterium]
MEHHHHHPRYNFIFLIGILLNLSYVILEFGFGIYLNSLALISDSVHNLSDVLSLIISWLGMYFTSKKPTNKRTYGFRRASILSSFLNSVILFMAIGGILVEAIQRLKNPVNFIDSELIIKVAIIGIFINFGTALLFYKDQHHDINIKSAFLHMLADGFITVGVIIAAIIIYYTNLYWIDPLISIIISIIIFWSTWKLFYESFNLMMDAVPQSIDIEEIKKYFENLPGIEDVHDLHIWAMSTTEIALTVHLVKPDQKNDDELLIRICKELENKFNIHHSTIQFERKIAQENCNQGIENRV